VGLAVAHRRGLPEYLSIRRSADAIHGVIHHCLFVSALGGTFRKVAHTSYTQCRIGIRADRRGGAGGAVDHHSALATASLPADRDDTADHRLGANPSATLDLAQAGNAAQPAQSE